MTITWHAINVNCLILSAAALQRYGGTVTLGPIRTVLHTASGGAVDLDRANDVPWLRLQRASQVTTVCPVRTPMAIEAEDPPETRSVESAAPAAATGAAESEEAQEASAVSIAAPSGAEFRETARRPPAPVTTSEEGNPARGVKVPDGPTSAEKE